MRLAKKGPILHWSGTKRLWSAPNQCTIKHTLMKQNRTVDVVTHCKSCVTPHMAVYWELTVNKA